MGDSNQQILDSMKQTMAKAKKLNLFSNQTIAKASAGENKTQVPFYRPPFALMFRGSFEHAKDHANAQNKWLIVNLQSATESNSNMLNRDVWANKTVSQTIKKHFVFWQVNDDAEEGRKVCMYYSLHDLPAVLLVDPLTGQKMQSWFGMVQPETLLEDLLPYINGSPSDHHVSFSRKRSRESSHPQDKAKAEDELLKRALAVLTENDGIRADKQRMLMSN